MPNAGDLSFVAYDAPRIARQRLHELAYPELVAEARVREAIEQRDRMLEDPRGFFDREAVTRNYTLDIGAEKERYRARARAELERAASEYLAVSREANAELAGRLADELAHEVARLFLQLEERRPNKAAPEPSMPGRWGLEARDGMLWCDAALFDFLEELGERDADDGRSRARARWQKFQAQAEATKWPPSAAWEDPAEVWRLWAELTEGGVVAGLVSRAVSTILPCVSARALLLGTAKPIRHRQNGEDTYRQLPKVASPVSWAFGAPGASAVEVDGDHFAEQPGVAALLVPRSWNLLPTGGQPHQTCLPIDLEQEHDGDGTLPVAVANAQGYVLTPGAGKLALLFLGEPAVQRGGLVKATLKELWRITHPGAKRCQSRDIAAVAAELEELWNFVAYMPDCTKLRVFDGRVPWHPKVADAEMEVCMGLTRNFGAAMGEVRGPGLAGSEYRGKFMVNMTGVMRLPPKKPALLRLYIRAAAAWNAAFHRGGQKRGSFNRAALQGHTLDQWAALGNTMSPSTVEYLVAQGAVRRRLTGRRRRVQEERVKLRADLEQLEAEGLVRLEHRAGVWRLLPTDAHQAAWEAQRQGDGT